MSTDDFPPLPKGFNEAPAAQASGDFPALPTGFKEPSAQPDALAATTDATTAPMDRKAFDNELITRIKRGDSKSDIQSFTTDAGYGMIPNIDEVLQATRGKHKLPLANKVVHLEDGPNLHVRIGNVITNLAKSGALPALAAGALRAPMKLAEGLGQVESRVKGAITGDDATARLEQFGLNQESDKIDQDAARSDYGALYSAGEMAGNLAETFALPLGAVTKFGKIANIGATIGKRAAVGGVTAALDGAKARPEDQDTALVTGALLTPTMVPVTEKIFGALGAKAGNLYASVLGKGVGKNLFDASGNLTTTGAVMRARLRAVNRDLPDQLIDDSMAQLAKVNPKVLPEDKAIVPDMLASKEGVPLTGAMKSRDAKGIQDFESMQTGSVGGENGQQAALARSKDIDTAITGNIKSVGTGQTSDTASSNVASKLTKGYDAAVANVDKLYEPLNKMVINDVKRVGQIATDARASFGKGAYQTLGTTARGYVDRINSIADGDKASFGDLWKLSKDINADIRTATSNDRHQLTVIKGAVDNFFTDASTSGSGITKAAAEQLKIANAANRQFSRRFGENSVRLRAGSGAIPDTAGKAVQKIVALSKNAADRGEELNPGQVENAIFGNAKALDSAGAKQATATIQRIAKAAPDAMPHVKDITLNRIVSQIEEGLYDKSLKAGKAQTVISQAIDGNRSLLSAAGFSDKDITRLQTNAYLASLKVPPVGAAQRGSSATNRGVGKRIAMQAFRRTLAAALGVAATHEAGGMAGVLGYGLAEAGIGAADALGAKRLAAKALSSKATLRPSSAGTRAGGKLGKAVGARTAIGISGDQ